MQKQNTENRKGSLKMTTQNIVIKNGIEMVVEVMGSHTVQCKAVGFCTIPGYYKKQLVKLADGTFKEKRTKFHKMSGGYTQYTPVEKVS